MSLKATILDETRSIQKYISNMAAKDAERMSKAYVNNGKRSSRKPWQSKVFHAPQTDGNMKSYQRPEKAELKGNNEATGISIKQ